MSSRGILIFDVGKTNKKVLVFSEDYRLVHEESHLLAETEDEDHFPCEDVTTLTTWIATTFDRLSNDCVVEICAVNFSGYGASFVCVDEKLKPILPLTNYLKPYPDELLANFYETYGGKLEFAKETASPVLGNLNSGMQLYSLAKLAPRKFAHIRYALHLPQYLSSILTRNAYSEITSIGCHTNLWNFQTSAYHAWLREEGILRILPPIQESDKVINIQSRQNKEMPVGIGLHDSSAALIPYLIQFHEPFVLISTGTWNICLNPFNASPLTDLELEQDCLCYLDFKSMPVKASRLFAGHEHEEYIKLLASRYQKNEAYFTNLEMNKGDLNDNDPSAIAYLEFMKTLVAKQQKSLNLVLNEHTKKIFVDGGFSKNSIFMHLLSDYYKTHEVFAATVPQASALGAALVIHHHWNTKSIPKELVKLQSYSSHSTPS